MNQILYDNEVCNPPVEAVIAYKSDRIARDIKLYFYFLFVLEKRGIKLLSVKEQFDDDPYGLSSVYRALMLFVAEQERKTSHSVLVAAERPRQDRAATAAGTYRMVI